MMKRFNEGEIICHYEGDLVTDPEEMTQREVAHRNDRHNYIYHFSDRGRMMWLVDFRPRAFDSPKFLSRIK